MTDVASIRVLCADDNELIGQSVRIKLRQAGGFDWAGQVTDLSFLLEEAVRTHPDIVLLDIDMPGGDPFLMLEALARALPTARVIMLTGHVRRTLIDRAFEAGAWGYLSKNDGPDALVPAIRRVLQGEVVMGADADAALGG